MTTPARTYVLISFEADDGTVAKLASVLSATARIAAANVRTSAAGKIGSLDWKPNNEGVRRHFTEALEAIPSTTARAPRAA